MDKNMLEGLYSLPTGAVWGANPWDLPLIEKGRQASLPHVNLGENGAAGLDESLIELQIVSSWGSQIQFPPECPPESPLIFSPGLEHLGCLVTLGSPRLPLLGQQLGMDVLSEGPPLVLAMHPQIAADLLTCPLNLGCHPTIL